MTAEAIGMSPLSRVVWREGYAVEVRIFEDGECAWLLQIVDDDGCMTGWVDAFATDRAAFDCAMQAIDEQGITAFVGRAGGGFPWPANEFLPRNRTQRCKESRR